ncbi:MAG: hypothetical protein JNM88_21400 [Chitinophagaceae bacterium]|nr:hypothetical protein [Chitinophagaceae bacterium]
MKISFHGIKTTFYGDTNGLFQLYNEFGSLKYAFHGLKKRFHDWRKPIYGFN